MNFKALVYRALPARIKEYVDDKYKKEELKRVLFEGYHKFENSNGKHNINYFKFLDAFCSTSGVLFEDLHQEIIASKTTTTFKESEGVLGKMDKKKSDQILSELRKSGYSVFGKKLSEEKIKSIRRFAETNHCYISSDKSPQIFDEFNPKAEIYRFKFKELMENPDIQSLIMDKTLISIAREYLGCEPIFDFPAMWWSPVFQKKASADAAQKYHFDLDRIKWIKIFIYLYDVGDGNGPHYYIEGTHKSGVKTKNILDRGYVRIEDDNIYAAHGKEKEKKILGEAGTIFAGDTMCWHKGSAITEGKRLVLEFQYTSSCFGSEIESFMVNSSTKEFADFCNNNPHFSQRINFA